MQGKPNRVLHVVSVSFSLSYFVGRQFHYFKQKDSTYNFYVACSPSDNLTYLSKELDFTPVPVIITRSISPLQDLKAIFALFKFIRENKISIVVGHTPKGGLVAMLAAFFAGIQKRTYFRHGIMYETSSGLKRVLLKNIERITGFFATQVICVSEEIKSISNEAKLSFPEKNIVLGRGTCNGVDCLDKYSPENKMQSTKLLKEQYRINHDDFVLGYVGRLVKDKGINELVAAWQMIDKTDRNKKLLLVGPFEERDKISDDTQHLILNDKSIIFTDFVVDASIYYPLMKAFILPSYREGFPTVILEASSMELPVLTTRATGCREAVVENETGIFFKIDKHEIADAINYCIENPERAIAMGRKGRAFVSSNFEQTKIWDIIEEKILKS